MNQKTCTKCKESLSIEEFGNDRTRKDGKFPQCKSCCRLAGKQNYANNKERAKANAARWKKQNPERVKEIRNKYNQEHKEENREYQKNWAREYRKKNPLNHRRWPKTAEKLKEWRQANPDKYRNQKLRRRSREAGTKQFIVTAFEIKKLLSSPCIYCGAEAEHIDHVVPISRGGEHRIGNLVPACARCNLTKSNNFIMEWKLKNA